MNLGLVFESGDAVLIGVFLSLVAMSLATWYLIAYRVVKLMQAKKANQVAYDLFWKSDSLQSAEMNMKTVDSPLSEIALHAMTANRQFADMQQKMLSASLPKSDFLEREIRHSMTKVLNRFDAGLSVLASVGSTAPFIGLLGTVWGIYHALEGIHKAGTMSIAAVAGPIGEALVATAVGLFVAIPAVLAYNYFARKNKVLSRQLNDFSHDLHVYLINVKES